MGPFPSGECEPLYVMYEGLNWGGSFDGWLLIFLQFWRLTVKF